MCIQLYKDKRNDSKLSYVDCCIILQDITRSFEGMSDDDLDSIYYVAYGVWANFLSRKEYVSCLNNWRKQNLIL